MMNWRELKAGTVVWALDRHAPNSLPVQRTVKRDARHNTTMIDVVPDHPFSFADREDCYPTEADAVRGVIERANAARESCKRIIAGAQQNIDEANARTIRAHARLRELGEEVKP